MSYFFRNGTIICSENESYQDDIFCLIKRLNEDIFVTWHTLYELHSYNKILSGSNVNAQIISSFDQYSSNILTAVGAIHNKNGKIPEYNWKKISYSRYKELWNIIDLYPDILKLEKKYHLGETVDQSILKLDTKLFADIIKLRDQYTIRLGDGKYWVVSGKSKVHFRDPSERPSWGVWFLEAIPFDDMPDRGALLCIPEDERNCPEPIGDDQPIVCHASLWQFEENKTGVLLHTSWAHIAASYRWVVNKPIDVTSILFRSISYPAQLARNFGYMPNLAIPGDFWFK